MRFTTALRLAGSICVFLLPCALSVNAEVELVPDMGNPAVFGSGKRSTRVSLRNLGQQAMEANLRYRLFQGAAGTLVPLGEARPFRKVPIGAGQTVIESLELELPPVRGEVIFHIVWFDEANKLGTTSLRAFANELLRPLSALAGDTPVGLVDPESHFKAALATIRVQELKGAEDISAAEARLILIAPMAATNQPAGLARALKRKVLAGAAVVWTQAPTGRQVGRFPECYVLEEGNGRVVIAPAHTVYGVAQSPQAQLNLVHLAELAVGRSRLKWPEDSVP